jgi:hypothetical protein
VVYYCMSFYDPILNDVLFSHLKIAQPAWCNCRLQEIKTYEFGVTGGISVILIVIKICPAALELKHADRQTESYDQPCMRSFCAHLTYNE